MNIFENIINSYSNESITTGTILAVLLMVSGVIVPIMRLTSHDGNNIVLVYFCSIQIMCYLCKLKAIQHKLKDLIICGLKVLII